jgi:hypothetical protein
MEPGISFFCLNSKGYLPQPPRVWSRVQNSCSIITGPEEGEFVQVPYSTKIVPYAELGTNIAMLRKGNVLQYKKNSSNLTKQQIYSLIAKGQWTNRTKTWATQSDRGYTNPNNQSYIRVGTTNVTLDGVPTFLPVTCPRFPIINNGVLPAIAGGGTQNNVLPPPVIPAPNAGGSVIPLVPVAPVEPIVIQDFGNLVCGTFENLCTGEIIRPILLDNCHPTTDSDVPGPIEELCWNDGNPTWYPRQRYVMSNSTDKWPVNAQLGCAIKFDELILTASIISCNVIVLSWNLDPFYTSFNIYEDGLIIATVNGITNTYTVIVDNAGTLTFNIKGINGNVKTSSNNIYVTIDPNLYTIATFGNINITKYSSNGYNAIVFDNSSTSFRNGTCIINFCFDIPNTSILIVGGGGGGAAGDKNPPSPSAGVNSAGAGGGGGSITYLTGQTISGSIDNNVTVGFGGAGKSPGNGGFGNLTGQAGTASIFSSYTAGGGGGGRGDGSTTVGGGDGGSSSSGYGGGGGGGGASIASPAGAATKGGPGGIGSLGNGLSGADVNSSFPTTGGTGGNNALTSVTLPFTSIPVTLNLGGGGGGGGTVSGGSAGKGTGGVGGTTIGSSPGKTASSGIANSAYGGGGGGSGINATSSLAIGGNGGNGTVIIWWPI